jgi:hypothetical protein
MVDRSGRLPLEVAVGVQPPPHWAQIEAYGDEHRLVVEAARWGRTWTRPAIASGSIEWDSFNVVPRYVGSESTACFAALQPGWSREQGAEEFGRFQESAARRGETALIISTIGDPEVQPTRSLFGGDGASIGLPELHGSISGRRLPQGGVPEVAAGLSAADRDLALRVRDTNDVWWALELTETTWERGDGTGSGVHKPGGTIHPLLLNHLGEIVAGIWIPPDRDWRWYVVPGGTRWDTLIAWAVDQAAPAFVPSALRRARSADLIDDELLTPAEVAARLALGAFDHEAAATRARLESDLKRATDDANAVRHDLLFGTGDVLKNVVARVLRGAGLVVEDLDNTFGSGRSSDLLVTSGEVNCLVEVRSAAGMPGEAQIDDLDRHMRTWAALDRAETVHRTAFVINHQHALSPLSRKPRAYERQEFLDSLHHSVIPSMALYAWWRDADHGRIMNALISGPIRAHSVDLARPAPESAATRPAQATAGRPDVPTEPRTRRWRSR